MSSSTVSLANPFFSDVRLLERTDGGYVPAPEVFDFARTYRWDAEEATRELAPVLAETWFAKALLPRLSYSPLNEQAALTELDKEATAGPEYRSQLRTLLEYLEAAGLIERDGDLVKPGEIDSPGPSAAQAQATSDAEMESQPSPPPSAGTHPFIEGLLRELPPAGGAWTLAKREQWLEMARLTVDMIYEVDMTGQDEPPATASSESTSPAERETAPDMPH